MINRKKAVDYRYEKKYFIDTIHAHILEGRIKGILQADQNSSGRPYHISSLYFDDYHNASFYEKQNGVLVRDKFRARFYNDDLSFIRLECKHKYGELVKKTDMPLTAQQYESMKKGDFGFLFGREEQTAHKFYARHKTAHLKPSVMVEYDRKAYIYGPGNVRVTFDSDITAAGLNGAVKMGVLPEGMAVLEVKFDRFLPAVVGGLLTGIPLTQVAISKFVMAEYMLHNEHRAPAVSREQEMIDRFAAQAG